MIVSIQNIKTTVFGGEDDQSDLDGEGSSVEAGSGENAKERVVRRQDKEKVMERMRKLGYV